MVITLSLAALAIVVVAAVHDDADAKPAPAAAPADAPVAEPVANAGPPGTAPVAEADKRFAGTAREVLLAGSYVYVEVELDGGETRWVVGTDDPPRVGERVQVTAFGERINFRSPRLDREFARLLFGQFTSV